MNKAILSPEVQQFLEENSNQPGSAVALKKSPFPEVSSRELAEQIDSRRRTEKKLPLWFSTPGIYYPPKLSTEQSSSEPTARYKSSLVENGRLIDLTGGFGVDSFYFSKKARVWHLEINKELSEIARHNAGVLGADHITFVNADGIQYLKATADTFDTIYVDPSRRVKTQKVFRLSDCEPDVVSNLGLLQEKAEIILIKTAPLLEIQSAVSELRNVREVHVLSVKNDCKELLFLIDKRYEGEAAITCVALNEEEQRFQFTLAEERNMQLENYSKPSRYIYEPDVALLKAGCFKLITTAYHVSKLHPNTHLYTSNELNSDFMGRKFRLLECWDYKSFQTSKPLSQANVICRNFPLSPEEVKKKNKVKDGGEAYLLFTTGPDNKFIVLHCRRL